MAQRRLAEGAPLHRREHQEHAAGAGAPGLVGETFGRLLAEGAVDDDGVETTLLFVVETARAARLVRRDLGLRAGAAQNLGHEGALEDRRRDDHYAGAGERPLALARTVVEERMQPARQGEGEDRAEARTLFDLQPAAHQPGEMARDGEAEAGAAVPPRGGAVSLLEFLEDHLARRRRDPRPGVGDAKHQRAFGVALDPEADAAARGEIHRIAGEIDEHLAHARGVAADGLRRVRRDIARDLEMLGLGARRQ